MKCYLCDNPASGYISPLDGEPRCLECARIEIIGLFEGADKSDLAKLRRRVEDRLRKSPGDLWGVIALLASTGSISWQDLL
jgi:hypothetical protein